MREIAWKYGRPVSDEVVRVVESQLGVVLPSDCRAVVAEHNGGRLEPNAPLFFWVSRNAVIVRRTWARSPSVLLSVDHVRLRQVLTCACDQSRRKLAV